MSEVWESMGFMRWPLAFSLQAVLVLAALSAYRLYRSEARADLHTKAWMDAILFWGGFATVSGVLGTLVGIIITAQSVEQAGAVSVALLAGGLKVAMLTSAFGVLILGFSSLVWFGLQLRWRLLAAADAEAA